MIQKWWEMAICKNKWTTGKWTKSAGDGSESRPTVNISIGSELNLLDSPAPTFKTSQNWIGALSASFSIFWSRLGPTSWASARHAAVHVVPSHLTLRSITPTQQVCNDHAIPSSKGNTLPYPFLTWAPKTNRPRSDCSRTISKVKHEDAPSAFVDRGIDPSFTVHDLLTPLVCLSSDPHLIKLYLMGLKLI